MSAEPVVWSLDARGVATLTLNRPEVNNAYDAALLDGVMAAMDALGARPGGRKVASLLERTDLFERERVPLDGGGGVGGSRAGVGLQRRNPRWMDVCGEDSLAQRSDGFDEGEQSRRDGE